MGLLLTAMALGLGCGDGDVPDDARTAQHFSMGGFHCTTQRVGRPDPGANCRKPG